MRYKLILKPTPSNFNVTCACGKCSPEVTIDESAKEDFKKMMGWSENDWKNRTVVVDD